MQKTLERGSRSNAPAIANTPDSVAIPPADTEDRRFHTTAGRRNGKTSEKLTGPKGKQ